MSKTRGARPLDHAEIAAAKRLRAEDRLSWREIGRIMKRDHVGLNRACGYMKIAPAEPSGAADGRR